MTMKKRIFISNTAMVLISLLILFGIGGFSVLLFKEEILRIIEQNAELSDDIYEVETLLLEQQKRPDQWEALSDKLSDYQFELYVSDSNQNEVYSNVRHSEMECIEELEEGTFASNKVKLYSMESVTIARCIISSGGEKYTVYAAYYPEELSLWGMDRGVFEMFIIVFVISGIILISGLLLCCQLFTKAMIKRIMKPIDALNQAAIRINHGNLEEPICYEADDELGEVCNTFNEMQKHLKEGMEKNEKYEKARTEMVSGISHDLRTPLTSVKGFIKGMLDGIANTPEKREQYLQISYQKACDMEQLLQKLFFFSKLETGNMPFFMQKIEMKSWIHKYVEERQWEEIEKNYTIQIVNMNAQYWVMADAEQMKRVFDNLLENSLKYANTKQLQISVSADKKGGEVYLYFRDNGVGISEDKLPYVFEQFYRGDESRNSKTDGSGLGLYVCKYIVEQQGGRIQAYNKNGFMVEIVLPEAHEKEENCDG